jgi:hypothetical protein
MRKDLFMDLVWKKCGDDAHWCSLETLDLSSLGDIAGVYIIWHPGNPARVVRLGQGAPIADRLSAHRNDKEILAYREKGTLRVTWAAVPLLQRDGVERYMSETWPPLVGEAFPLDDPIPVNSPWNNR